MLLSAGLIFTTILGSLLLTLFLAIQIGEAPRHKSCSVQVVTCLYSACLLCLAVLERAAYATDMPAVDAAVDAAQARRGALW